jgi:hypothetical protein
VRSAAGLAALVFAPTSAAARVCCCQLGRSPGTDREKTRKGEASSIQINFARSS